jgi:hypothetical protein
MPKKETGDNNHKKPEKPIFDAQTSLIHGDTPNSGKEHVGSETTASEATKPPKPRVINIGKIPKIDVIEGIEANKIAKSANKISRWSVIVSALLFAITLLIAYQAIRQSKAASDSVALARQTYLADSVYKRKTERLAKISDSLKFIRDTATFNLQRAELYKQIEALKEANKQFTIGNEPYLQLEDMVVTDFEPGKKFTISFNVFNLGNYPIKAIAGKAFWAVRRTDPTINYPALDTAKWRVMNKFIMKEIPEPFTVDDDLPVSAEKCYAIEKMGYFMWYGGIIKYQNLSTKEIKYYKYMMRIIPPKKTIYTLSENDKTTN